MAKRGKYGKWTSEEMDCALEALRGGVAVNECAQKYGIPKATLMRHANGSVKCVGRSHVFSAELEEEIVEHISKLESGIAARAYVYDIAEKNNIKHNFNRTTKLAGNKWYYAFMKRHPKLSLRRADAKSTTRANNDKQRGAKRGKYGEWTTEEMDCAIEDLRGGVGVNKCAREYGIPKATLRRHANGSNAHASGSVKCMGRALVFSAELEEKIADCISQLQSSESGFTVTDVRRLVYDLAEKNNIKHNFNRTTKLAGKKWYYTFLKRHPELSLCQTETTSTTQERDFNNDQLADPVTSKNTQEVEEEGDEDDEDDDEDDSYMHYSPEFVEVNCSLESEFKQESKMSLDCDIDS